MIIVINVVAVLNLVLTFAQLVNACKSGALYEEKHKYWLYAIEVFCVASFISLAAFAKPLQLVLMGASSLVFAGYLGVLNIEWQVFDKRTLAKKYQIDDEKSMVRYMMFNIMMTAMCWYAAIIRR